MVEVMKIMATSFKRSYACTVHSVPPALQQATMNPHSTGNSWTLIGKSGSVSCGITAPFSWVLVCTRLCLCPPRDYFPVLCKFWQLYGRVNGDLLQEGLCHPQVCCTQPYPSLQHPEPLPLWQSTTDPYLHRRHSDTVLSQSLWGLWVLVHTRFV